MDKRILIISNNGLSESEPNGRVFASLFALIPNNNLYSFCMNGVLNKVGVNYIQLTIKTCLKSLLTFGFVKPRFFRCDNGDEKIAAIDLKKKTKKKAFYYWVRNVLFGTTIFYKFFVSKIVKDNNINIIFIFGTDAPFLYKNAYYWSRKNNVPLYCYTGEDYCFKDYNYLEGGMHSNNLFFKMNQRRLYINCKKAFEHAHKCFFTSNMLMERYKQEFSIKSAFFKPLPSLLSKIEYSNRPIKRIVYAGNIYKDRAISIVEVAKTLFELDKTITLDIYGKINNEDRIYFDEVANINYLGVVDYSVLVGIIKKADMLLHAEGFDDYFIKDCKYAFSTKISDYYILGIPFFLYSPIEIASTSYCLSVSKDYVAVNKNELFGKLKNIIDGKVTYKIDYNKIAKEFSHFSEEDLS